MITIDNKNLQLSEEQENDLRLEIAIMLSEKADYSFYVAAKLAGMHRMEGFSKRTGKNRIIGI